jgi:cytochrome bd-type quinol oxidase subunit 1
MKSSKATFLAFPAGFIAILTGWFTAEVGRQPWVIYGLLRTRDAVTPALTTVDVSISLAGYLLVYVGFVSFGVYYIYKLLPQGPRRPRPRLSREPRAADRWRSPTPPESATGGGLRARG